MNETLYTVEHLISQGSAAT